MEIKLTPYLRKAQFYETDQAGIIHHANYVHWMEEARADMMDQMGYGYQRVAELGIHFVLFSIGCQYKSMVRFGETVRVLSTLSELNPLLMTVTYRMFDEPGGILRATAESRHCAYDIRQQRPARLDMALPELYETLKRHHIQTPPAK